MPWKKGFNFRQTPEGTAVGEGTYSTYVSQFPYDGYATTRNGVDFGAESLTGALDSRNRSSAVDARLSGIWFPASTIQVIFRVDLPATGDYLVRLACGDATWGLNVVDAIIMVVDSGTPLFTIDHATDFTTASTWRDATDALITSADWLTADGGASRLVTFETTVCRVYIGSTTRAGHLAHFAIEQVEGAPAGPVIRHSGMKLGLVLSA
jgi:hypothetical protein